MERKKGKQQRKEKKLSFFNLIEQRILYFERRDKKKTASNYICAFKHFKRFRGDQDIAIEDLTVGQMKDFQSYLIGEGLRMNTISLYNRELRAVYNYALDEEIIQMDKRPFRKSFTGQEKTRKRAVDGGVVKRLAILSLIDKEMLGFARDLFLFSIYMQGMPFIDMAYLKKEQVRNGCITYQRRKTNRQLRVKIHPQAQIIIDRYMVSDPGCPYLFPILYDPEKKTEREYSSALRVYNKRLDSLSSLLELDEPLTSYVARHTWASLARHCGTSDTVISEAMGHSHVGVTTIYLASLDIGMVAMANQRVITSLFRKRIP